MSTEELTSTTLVIPDQRRPSWQKWGITVAVAGLAGVGLVLGFARPSQLWSKPTQAVETFEIDQGDVALVVTENGTLESANNATVRCEVEALIGLTGGANGASRGGATAQQGQAAPTTTSQPAAAPVAKKAAGGAATAKAGGTKAKVTGAGVASTTPAPAATGGTAAAATGMKRPDIRSFNYIVEPHIPLRGAKVVAATKKTQANVMMGGSGGRGGGGGGGRGGATGPTELPGSTRIIEIIPEGTRVQVGDIVCELESSAFREELQSQQIRYLQAKSWVEQAKTILDVNIISLREYEEGIYPQDVQLIRQYITACTTEQKRTALNLAWSRDAASKGYRAAAQVRADQLAEQQAAFVLSEAEGMERRLKNYTMPRIMKARQAKIEAIKSDLSAQESAFALETQRLKRLEQMIQNCTMRAPRDGIVVYANQTNSWGRTEAQIQEGVTVRQTQPIFYVPDPKNMRVKARVNESKTSLIHSGQRVIVRIDAFPDRPLTGTVGEITPIPAPASIANLDVQIYYATVSLDAGGFDGLRPGLSAEVNFLIDTHRQVTRIPLRGVHWVGNQPFAAVAQKKGDATTWAWVPLKLGVADSTFAEVVSGLEPGQRVSTNPKSLPPPPALAPVQAVAKHNAEVKTPSSS